MLTVSVGWRNSTDPHQMGAHTLFLSIKIQQVFNSRVSLWLRTMLVGQVLLGARVTISFNDVSILGEDAAVFFWQAFATGTDGPSLSSAGWATAWRWEDASSSLSCLYRFLFSQSVAEGLPRCYLSVCCSSGEEFSPHGSRRHGNYTNLLWRYILWLWLWFKSASCLRTLLRTPTGVKNLLTPAQQKYFSQYVVIEEQNFYLYYLMFYTY